jgi:[acyl-carrier-protein] S-malonyltransferase
MDRIAVLFSGQGAQAPGMMKDLFEKYGAARRVYEIANETLGRDIATLTFEGAQEDLNLTHNTQPCMLAADLAAYEALKENGIAAEAAAGFSLGEYGALVVAGCIFIEDAFPIVQKRADYMQEAVPVGEGAMAAIGGKTLEEVQSMCDAAEGYVVPANINCPGQIVISGRTEAVQAVVENARSEKIKAMVLAVSAPFHCALLEPAAVKLAQELEKISIRDSGMKLYMNVDGESESMAGNIKRKIILQAKSPVYWEKTLRNMYADGIRVFVECGPGKTLSGFVKKTFKGQEDVVSLRVSDINTLKETVEFFKGVN